jgi:hypothetical protein
VPELCRVERLPVPPREEGFEDPTGFPEEDEDVISRAERLRRPGTPTLLAVVPAGRAEVDADPRPPASPLDGSPPWAMDIRPVGLGTDDG